uniref:Uncharacterized protein n=1 Tax=Panagrolaimus davidi TaxID=227884 RepID=A0A914PED1_9BILA
MTKHFIKVAIIWVLILLCFVFCFQILTEGKHPTITHSSNATSEEFLTESISKFFHVGNHISDYETFERKFYKAFQLVTIIILITLAISKDFRGKAEQEILRIKTNFCIEALHLSLKMDVVDEKVPFYRSQVNNVLVIDKYNGKTYSTYINLSKLKVLKAITQKGPVKKRVRFPSIEDIPPSDFLTSGDKIDFTPNQDIQFIQELENMQDKESYLTKFKRWFSCLDWKTSMNCGNPKYFIIPKKIPV